MLDESLTALHSVFAHPLPELKFRALCACFPHAHHGFDRKGQPIYIDCTGQLDVDKVLEVCSVEEVLHSHVIMMEFQNRLLMAVASARTGSTIHKMCNIVDLRGASLRLASRKAMLVFKGIAAIDQAKCAPATRPAIPVSHAACCSYPETMGATYVVNAPWIFATVWKVARVFLDEGVRAKVNILAEGEPTRAALAAAVEPAQLPAFLGGACACEGGCVSGRACSSADGMVASQRRILAFCRDYAAALAEGGEGEAALLQRAVAAMVAEAPPFVRPAAAPATPRVAEGGAGEKGRRQVASPRRPSISEAAPTEGEGAQATVGPPPRRRRGFCGCGLFCGRGAAADEPAAEPAAAVAATVPEPDLAPQSRQLRAQDSFFSSVFVDAEDDSFPLADE